MKSLSVLLMVAGSLLTGCVVEESGYGYRDGAHYDRDRDRDGVPNRYDRRPDDPRRY
jgi:hypothetical protein